MISVHRYSTIRNSSCYPSIKRNINSYANDPVIYDGKFANIKYITDFCKDQENTKSLKRLYQSCDKKKTDSKFWREMKK